MPRSGKIRAKHLSVLVLCSYAQITDRCAFFPLTRTSFHQLVESYRSCPSFINKRATDLAYESQVVCSTLFYKYTSDILPKKSPGLSHFQKLDAIALVKTT